MILPSEIQLAENLIKKTLRDTGYCPLSVEEIIWLFRKTGTWDVKQWEGILVPYGIGAV